MSTASESRVPCSEETRKALQHAKRGGETYDAMLQKMLDWYDPDAAFERQTRENA